MNPLNYLVAGSRFQDVWPIMAILEQTTVTPVFYIAPKRGQPLYLTYAITLGSQTNQSERRSNQSDFQNPDEIRMILAHVKSAFYNNGLNMIAERGFKLWGFWRVECLMMGKK